MGTTNCLVRAHVYTPMQRALHSVKPSLRGPSNGPRPRILVRPWTSLLTPTRRCSPAPAPPAALCDARRFISTTPPRRQDAPAKYTIGNLTEREYHDISNTAMDHLTEYLEEKLEELDVPGLDVEYSTSMCGKSGVLTVKLGAKGTYVINKQPPNKQIWLSSPVSGPKRYDFDTTHRVWFYARDGGLMHDLLNRELRESLGDESIEVDLAEEGA